MLVSSLQLFFVIFVCKFHYVKVLLLPLDSSSLIVKLKNRIDKKQTLNKNETLRTW